MVAIEGSTEWGETLSLTLRLCVCPPRLCEKLF